MFRNTLTLAITLALASFSACSSAFIVKSDPLQADVFVLDPVSGVKKAIGKTPLELAPSAIREAAGEAVLAGECFSVIIEKKDYVSEKILVPSSRFGTLATVLDVKLKKGENEKEQFLAQDALDHLFLARSMALKKEYQRAQVEVDKVLTTFPAFPRALAMRASIYYMEGKLADSQKWYEEALKADPKFEDAVKMLGNIREKQGGARGLANGRKSGKP